MLTADDLRGHILASPSPDTYVSLEASTLSTQSLTAMTLDTTKSPSRVQFSPPRMQYSLTMTIDLRLTLPRLRWSRSPGFVAHREKSELLGSGVLAAIHGCVLSNSLEAGRLVYARPLVNTALR